MQERTKRLRIAHVAAQQCEQEEYVTRLTSILDARTAENSATRRTANEEIEAEEKRHAAVLAEIDERKRESEKAVRLAAEDLERTKAGLTEEAAGRIVALRTQIRAIRSACGERPGEKSLSELFSLARIKVATPSPP